MIEQHRKIFTFSSRLSQVVCKQKHDANRQPKRGLGPVPCLKAFEHCHAKEQQKDGEALESNSVHDSPP